ncbi:T1SS-143 repeat domain-containing protein [Roseibium marinum]|uniref:T1SS-143 domain-containing protein n=1 Tax=Roseibium marinum TaxID=281252 RepID=A0A2S3UVT4_9HYPH|nr:DUF5801 repeats-in-toxin domain-containing protein [Roseibium marinum]POF31663.1 T1SS-143 domain-containing protein [Roseibium marinum]
MNEFVRIAQATTVSGTGGNEPPSDAGVTLALSRPEAQQSVVSLRLPGQLVDFRQILSEDISFIQIGDDLQMIFADGGMVIVQDFFLGDSGSQVALVGEDQVLSIGEFVSVANLQAADEIQTAAGETSNLATALGAPQGSGQNFQNTEIEGLGGGTTTLGLLGPDDLGAGGGAGTTLADGELDTVPTLVSDADSGFLDEGNLAEGNEAGEGPLVATGSLGINFGENAGPSPSLTFDTNGAGIPLDASGAPLDLSSDGIALTYTIVGNGDGGQTLTAAKEGTGEVVFTVTLAIVPDVFDGGASGATYTFTLIGNLDHLDAATDVVLPVSFSVTAEDTDGESIGTAFTVNVTDDDAVIGDAEASSVDEEGLGGNVDSGYDGDLAGSAITSSGNLAISWGADDANPTAGGGTGDRSVAFGDSQPGLEGLTSNGLAVSIAVLSDGTLVGYTGGSVPTATGDAGVVFFATLSDADSGSYAFTLVDNLDHPDADTEDDLDLTFAFTATDGDGDTASSTFTVTVDDDAPVIGAPVEFEMEAGSHESGNVDLPTIDDRAILSTIEVPAGGTIADVNVTIDLVHTFLADLEITLVSPDGTRITLITRDGSGGADGAITFDDEAAQGFDSAFPPFTGAWRPTDEALSGLDGLDQGGTWTLEIVDVGGGGTGTLRSWSLDFGPTSAASVNAIVDEDDLSGATGDLTDGNGDTEAGDDVTRTDSGLDTDGDATTVYGNLAIAWGADNANDVENGGTSAGDGDRAVTFASGTVAALTALGLTSQGEPLSYAINDPANDLLTATSEDGRVVFTVELFDTDTGSFKFDLQDALDHPGGSDENDIVLTFGYTATDSDGDTATSSFTVGVDDDVPVQGTAGTAAPVGEDGLGDANPADGSFDAVDDLSTGAVSLGIDWGADNDTRATGDTFGRTVAFSNGAATLASAGTVTAAQAGLTITGGSFTSGGVALVYEVTATDEGGQVLTAYKGSVGTGNEVFTITLDPTAANGSYTFELVGELDHDSGSDNLDIDFAFAATDADGDQAADGTASVSVEDDTPVQGTAGTAAPVGEDGLGDANATGGSFDAVDDLSTGAVSLGIDWGADNDTRATGDTFGRTVAFSNGAATLASAGTVTAAQAGLTITGGSFTSGGVALVYEVTATDEGGQVLTAYKGSVGTGNEVFTITLDPTAANGSYTFELVGELDHDSGSDNLDIDFAFAATDADGDQAADGTASVSVEDDTPVAATVKNVTVDEDDIVNLQSLGTDPWDTADDDGSTTGALDLAGPAFASGSLADAVSFGADGAASSGGFAFTSTAAADMEALELQSKGETLSFTITTVLGETFLIGYVDNGNGTFNRLFDRWVISVQLDGSGDYAVRLHDQLDHEYGDGTDSPTLVSGTGTLDQIDFGSVIQATDGDGDTMTLDGLFQVTVTDDIPAPSAWVRSGQSVRIDETFGLHSDNVFDPGSGTYDQDVVDLFTDITVTAVVDADLAGPIFARDDVIDYIANVGADENATVEMSLEIVGGDGIDSGLTTTEGEAVKLYAEGDLIVGRGETSGDPVFALHIDDDGQISIVQYQSLWHPDVSTSDEHISLTEKVSAVVTVTDADGDAVSTTVQIGANVITFDDDGPTAYSAGSRINADEASQIGTEVPGQLQFDGGADGATVTDVSLVMNGDYVRGLDLEESGAARRGNLTSNGQNITVSQSTDVNDVITVNGFLEGTATLAFQIVVQPDGGYTYEQFVAFDHPDENQTGSDDRLALRLRFTVTDGDGDTDSAAALIRIADDGPAIGAIADGTVDEDGLTDGNDDNQSGDAADANADGDSDETTFTGDLGIDWGVDDYDTDGAAGIDDGNGRSLTFDTGLDGATPVGLESSGEQVLYTLSNGGTLLTATKAVSGTTVFTVALDDDGTGSYTFTLVDALDHPDGTTEDDINLDFDFVATDSDGDTATDSFTVTVDDDSADARWAGSHIAVDEATDLSTTVVPGQLQFFPGADGATVTAASMGTGGGFVRRFDQEEPAGSQRGDLLVGGERVTQSVTTDPVTKIITIDGTTEGTGAPVFQIVIQPDGSYTYEQFAAFDHPDENETGAEDIIALRIDFTVTDGDGDTDSAGAYIRVSDDGPVQTGDGNHNVGMDEDDISVNGVIQGAGTDGTGPTQFTGNIGKVDFGADGFGSVTFSGVFQVPNELGNTLAANDTVGADSGLTSDDRAVYFRLVEDGQKIEAYVRAEDNGGTEEVIFDATLNGTDRGYTVNLYGNIDHQPGSAGRGNGQSINFDVRATDGDGDYVDVNLSLRITDDAPVQTGDGNHNVGMDEDDIPVNGVIQGAGTDGTGPTQFTGNIGKVDFGADGFGSVTFSGVFQVPNELGNTLAANDTVGADSGLTSDDRAVYFRLVEDGQKIEAYVRAEDNGGTEEVIFDATLNGTDRGYTVNLYGNIDHQPGSAGRGLAQSINFDVRATDGDGDYVDVNLSLRITDDAPETPHALRWASVDEAVTTSGTATGTYTFDVDYGADGAGDSKFDGYLKLDIGPGLAGNVTFDLTDPSVHQTPKLTSDGRVITFELVDDTTIRGYISDVDNGGGGVVEVLEITLSDTKVTFDLFEELDHVAAQDGSPIDGLVFDTGISFYDGDDDLLSVKLRTTVTDDGPVLAQTYRSVTVDEADISDSGSNSFNVDFGADGFGSTNFTGTVRLNIGPGTAGNVSIDLAGGPNSTSGLTSGGEPVTFELSADGQTILGFVDNGGVGDVEIIRLTLAAGDTGAIAELLGPLDHIALNGSGEIAGLRIDAQVAIADGDGDVVNGFFRVNVDDDTPTATPSTTVWVDDEDVPGADGNPGGVGDKTDAPLNLTGMLNHSFGADSDGASISWLDTSSATVPGLGFTYEVADGGATLLIRQNGTLVMTAKVVQETGHFTIIQEAPVSHPIGNDENEVTFQLRYEVTDGDGDTAQSYLWVNVDDDTPTASPSTTVWVDDEDVPGADGNPGGVGDKTDAPLNLTGMLNHSFGADSDGASISWLDTSSATVPGLGFTYEVADGGATLLIRQNGTLVMTAKVVQETGHFTIIQEAPVSHPIGNDENEVTFQLRYEVKDGDGDTAQSYLWVNVDDDTPVIGTANTTVQLDDENVGTDGNAGVGTDPEGTTPDETQDTDLTGTLAHLYGADGAGSLLLTGVDTLTSTPTTAEESFYYGVNAAGTLLTIYQIQSSVAVAVLSVTLDGETSGDYTVEQLAPIDHPDGSSENNVSFDVTYRVTDLDGDTIDGTLPINVDDDSPVANDDTTATSEDTAVLIDVFANDLAGADGVDLSTDVAVASGASNGSVSYNNNGTFTYTPNGGYAGADSFTYTITDADGDQSIATVNITVSAVDDGEATVTITGTAAEGSTLTANFGDDDPDGAASGVAYQWQRDGADIVGATGTTYDLVADDVGAKITVEVAYTDGQGFSENIESPQTDTVTALNAAPVLALNDIAAGATAFDDFSSGNYSGGSGWNGNWNEIDPGSQNDIRISSGRLRFDDSTDGGESISRAIDLSGMSTATLSFDYRGDDLDFGENVQIQAWNGSSWDTLGTLGGDSGGNFSIGLSSAQIGAHTQIRFLAQGNWESSENFYIDNVSVTNLAKVSSTDFVTSYTEGDAAVSVAAAGPTITDDNTILQSATIHLTNAQAGDILNTSGVTGVTVDGSSTATSVVLTGNASLEVYQAAIQAITFANTNDDADTTTPRTVEVSVTDIGGLTSNTATAEITFLPVNDGNASVGITGTAKEGSTLTANFGDDDPDGAASGVTYQWQRGGADIDGATGSTYDLVAADVGAKITVEVAYTDGQGFSENIESAQTDTVTTLNAAPTPGDDIVLKNFGGTAFNIPEWAFLLNDTDPEGDPLDVSGVSNVSSLDSVNHTAGSGPNGYVRIDGDNGSGLDGTFQYAASDGTTSTNATVTVVQDNNSITGSSADEIFAGDNDGDTFTGGGGKDAFFAGGGNDTIRGDQDDHVFDGGSGNDTLEVGANFTSTSDAQIVQVETVELTSAATLDLSNQSEGFKILGSSGNDTIVGGSGNDIINGQEGTDSFTGNGGADQFRLVYNTGTKTIVDYTDGTDKIGFLDTGPFVAPGSVNFKNTEGTAGGASLNSSDFKTASSIANMSSNFDYDVVRITTAQTTDQIQNDDPGSYTRVNNYVIVFNSDTGKGEIWFDVNWASTSGRYHVATLNNITSVAQLNNITASDIVVYSSAYDPIALDLNGDGVDLSATTGFDIDADGDLDQIGWTGPEDGLLVMDLDGSGKIEDGSELFSEVFNGGSFANSLEALASLDDNGDGVIDANDAAFSEIKVWRDGNSDGVTQEGELLSLIEQGIEAINLETAEVNQSVNGNTVFAEGTYTKSDGGTGTYVGVNLGAANDDEVDSEDTTRQSAALAAGAALIVYAASSAEVAAGLSEVRIDGTPLHGEVTVADDFTVTYTSMDGFEGADAVEISLVFADGSIVSRSVELEVLAEEVAVTGSSTGAAADIPDTGTDTAETSGSDVSGPAPELAARVTSSFITGDDGDNVLMGTDGDDILAGGLGADLLTGGAGADTFVLSSLAEADIITDYNFDEGDRIDLGSLLDSAFNPGADESTLVRATESPDGSVTIEVDLDGSDAGHDWMAAATLQDHASMGETIRIVMDQDGTEVDIAVNVA